MAAVIELAPPVPAPAPVPTRLRAETRRELRERVAKRDGWACFFCGCGLISPPRGRAWSPSEAQSVATLDHWLPVARGGKWRMSNLVLACPPCNVDKHSLTGDEYLVVLAHRRGQIPHRWPRLARLALHLLRPPTTERTTRRSARPVPGTTSRTVPGTTGRSGGPDRPSGPTAGPQTNGGQD